MPVDLDRIRETNRTRHAAMRNEDDAWVVGFARRDQVAHTVDALCAEIEILRRKLSTARAEALREAAEIVRQSAPSARDALDCVNHGVALWVSYQRTLAAALEQRAGEGG